MIDSELILARAKMLIESPSKIECLHVGINAKGELADRVSENALDMGARFLLGTRGDNPLIVFGVNPSTAVCVDGDPTIRKVRKVAERIAYSELYMKKSCSGWIMLNLYPQRTSKPRELPRDESERRDYIDANEAVIKCVLDHYEDALLLAAWGNNVNLSKRNYLKQCRDRIIELANNRNWLCVDELTIKGNPRHPLFADPSNIGRLSFESGKAIRTPCD